MKSNYLCKTAMIVILGIILFAGNNLLHIGKVSNQCMEKDKKAIVVVSFGTTYAEARKNCIEAVEDRIREAFPEYDVFRAFTSKIVIKRIAERENIHIDDLETVLAKLRDEGYTEVIVQTTHLTPGEEYENKVLAAVEPFKAVFTKIAVGRPLLYFKGDNGKPNDFAIAVEALRLQMPSDLREEKAAVF
ncbi:MAG: sirohydrochlorin cobaltochelatase, partial [Sporomusaceae bacterium]|nr:sirohydrochlorin cobaltochelatase [Sporomusaceae bacterium]